MLIAESLDPVTTAQNCAILSGRWLSTYDGVEVTDASKLDIDHVVPLAEAWASGAWAWDDGMRERYANDLDDGFALIAVSAHSNRSKGDADPAEWMPQKTDWWGYLNAFVEVKARWKLSIDAAEKHAIEANGQGC